MVNQNGYLKEPIKDVMQGLNANLCVLETERAAGCFRRQTPFLVASTASVFGSQLTPLLALYLALAVSGTTSGKNTQDAYQLSIAPGVPTIPASIRPALKSLGKPLARAMEPLMAFTHTIAHNPLSPDSVLIVVAAQAGDCPWFIGACRASGRSLSVNNGTELSAAKRRAI